MTQIDSQLLCQIAQETACMAGQITRERWHQPRQLNSKGFRDVVTDADLAAQTAITDAIRARFPDHVFLTEEEDDDLPQGDGPVTWIIDPIDGTSNYSRQIPSYCISIAAAQGGEVVAGAIYDPARDEMFHASRGGGAWLGGQRLAVSNTDTLAEVMFGIEWSRQPGQRRRILAALGVITPAVHTLRSIGTAALALAWVAAGRLDVYFNLSLYAWDFAAGALLIGEAGGITTGPAGGPLALAAGNQGCLAGNPTCYREALALVRPFAADA